MRPLYPRGSDTGRPTLGPFFVRPWDGPRKPVEFCPGLPSVSRMLQRLLTPALLSVLLLALPACRSTAFAPPPAAATLPAEPPNLSQLKQELKAYIDDGRYETGLAAAAAEAKSWIEQRARRGDGRLAVVFDIDETILSNLPHMREMDFGYVPALWDRWVEMADATPIAPVVEVFRAARQNGVAVFFITGRKTTDADGTIRNLRQTGLGDYAELHLKPANSPGTTQAFKTETRRRISEQGYTIIANLGDQHSDLEGGYSERTFKLPNPFYLTK